ncbi:MAG: hypothetical protein LBN95_13685 [Prevotellaceae bacterium]|nr:hypothetical protein [Prevotellaceae bacterium]
MKKITNIDMISIVTGARTNYHLPYSTNFNEKKVHRIICLAYNQTETSLIDPANNLPVYQVSMLQNCYINLKNRDGKLVFNNLPVVSLFDYFTDAFAIDDFIDWENSEIFFNALTDVQDNTEILFYVLYGEEDVKNPFDYYLTKTIEVPANYKGNLKEFINGDYGKLKKVEWASNGIVGFNNSFFFVTLWDVKGRVCEWLNSWLFAGDLTADALPEPKQRPTWQFDLEVDYQKSLIQTAAGAPVLITLYF